MESESQKVGAGGLSRPVFKDPKDSALKQGWTAAPLAHEVQRSGRCETGIKHTFPSH